MNEIKVYKFEDNETHWIVAYSQLEAEQYFVHEYSGNSIYTVELVMQEELNEKKIDNIECVDEDGERWVSLKEIASTTQDIPSVIASSIY